MRGLCLSFLLMETLSFFVLIGKTGSGKTGLLRSLDPQKIQVLDLEKIAGHSGSVFGTPKQKTRSISQKEFSDALLLNLSLYDPDLPVITEWKGRNLGHLKIPDFLYTRFITAPKILIERTKNSRSKELLKHYSNLKIEDLYKALFSLRPKFNEEDFQSALGALKEKNKRVFIKIMMSYYDLSSEYKISQSNIVLKFEWESQSVEEISGKLYNYFKSDRYKPLK